MPAKKFNQYSLGQNQARALPPPHADRPCAHSCKVFLHKLLPVFQVSQIAMCRVKVCGMAAQCWHANFKPAFPGQCPGQFRKGDTWVLQVFKYTVSMDL